MRDEITQPVALVKVADPEPRQVGVEASPGAQVALGDRSVSISGCLRKLVEKALLQFLVFAELGRAAEEITEACVVEADAALWFAAFNRQEGAPPVGEP